YRKGGPENNVKRAVLHRHIKTREATFIIVIIGAALRIVNILFQSDSSLYLSPTTDDFEHLNLASTLASGDWLGKSVGPYHRPQLFAYVNALLFALFGRIDFLITHIVNLVCDIAAIAVWGAVARRCFPRPAALLGMLFIALYWPFVHFSGTCYMESFAMFLNALFFLALTTYFQRTVRRKSAWSFLIAAGILAGLGILTRPTSLIVMPAVAFILR